MRSRNPMTVMPSPDRLAEPPPLELTLTAAHRFVGWVRGSVVGFRGFGSELEAVRAAWIAHRAVADREPSGLDRRDEAAAIHAVARPIATLVRPGDSDPDPVDSFGFEIRIPPPADEPRVRAIAHLVYRTLRTSGVRWALWARHDRPPPVRSPSAAADARARPERPTDRLT